MQPDQPSNQNRPSEGRIAGLISAVKGLTVANVLVIGMLVVIAAPAYLLYRALNDEELLDRFFSNFREHSSDVGCALRSASLRGSEVWGVSTGLAFQGADRYLVVVILNHHPDEAELASYCATVKAIADRLQGTSS
jgi:hypothetical protein